MIVEVSRQRRGSGHIAFKQLGNGISRPKPIHAETEDCRLNQHKAANDPSDALFSHHLFRTYAGRLLVATWRFLPEVYGVLLWE